VCKDDQFTKYDVTVIRTRVLVYVSQQRQEKAVKSRDMSGIRSCLHSLSNLPSMYEYLNV